MYFQIDQSVNREKPQNKFNCTEFMSNLQTTQENSLSYPFSEIKEQLIHMQKQEYFPKKAHLSFYV